VWPLKHDETKLHLTLIRNETLSVTFILGLIKGTEKIVNWAWKYMTINNFLFWQEYTQDSTQ
jgi:hypothetical protein